MTASDIVERLFNLKGPTPVRVQKAQGFASRSGLAWAAVLAAMTPEQQAAVKPV